MIDRTFASVGVLSALLALPAAAQQGTFESGSTGADGALTFAANAGTIDFDPAGFDPPLDPDGDNVYHFTSLTIPAGTTVRLRTRTLPEGRAVVWLVSGAVVIAGTLDLSGDNGHDWNQPTSPAAAGAGGYNGGTGGGVGVNPTTGNGPGGGNVGANHGGNAGFVVVPAGFGPPGAIYGNLYLQPLLGGSGGGGGRVLNTTPAAGGGGGGGALLLASSTSIEVTGAIAARGGNTGVRSSGSTYGGGGGSGGALRLIAPAIQGAGSINVSGGVDASAVSASLGRVRLEAFRFPSQPTVLPTQALTRAAPGAVSLPPTAPLIRVVRVAGQPVAANPTGSFVVPDVVINAGGPVQVELETRNVPAGTVLNLTFQPENATQFTATSTPLVDGGGGLGTASASASFPAGHTRVFVRATWTP